MFSSPLVVLRKNRLTGPLLVFLTPGLGVMPANRFTLPGETGINSLLLEVVALEALIGEVMTSRPGLLVRGGIMIEMMFDDFEKVVQHRQ